MPPLTHRSPAPPWATVPAALAVAGAVDTAAARAADAPWKAGVATVAITPDGPIWMAGYAARNKPSEGTALDLFAKALALEDAGGTKLVIVTMDLIGLPRSLRDAVAKQAQEKYHLPPASLLLNASHTHCGPVVRSGGSVMYDLPPGQSERLDHYIAG